MIRDRPGLALICKNSYKSNELDLNIFDPLFTISSNKSSIIVFDTSIMRENLPMKVAGWVGIFLLYGEGNIRS
jgi:hypothetical protein